VLEFEFALDPFGYTCTRYAEPTCAKFALAPDLGERSVLRKSGSVCMYVCMYVYAELQKRGQGVWKYNTKHVICAQRTCQVRDDINET
jgi:hypothetical protein